MKHLKLLTNSLALLLSIMAMALPQAARADRTVQQLQFGKQTIDVAADEVITFTDMKGYQGISSSSSNNSQSLTVFRPAEGYAIQMSIANLDVRNDGANWPGKVIVYDGDPDANETFTYATSTSGVNASSTLPTGTVLGEYDGTYTDLEFTSNDASGIISVGFLYRYAATCQGWKATVKCIKLEEMTVTGAASSYDNVTASPQSTTGVILATAQAMAQGGGNPDKVTGITFTLPVNENAINPALLRLYSGQITDVKNATAIEGSVTEDNGTYTFSPATATSLHDGTTSFTFVGDFLSDATPGAKVQLNINAIKTVAFPEGIAPFTAGTAVAVEKPAIALIAPTPQVITVGDVPYNFYDDGGKDGNITRNFEGQITFVPATQGNAIKIDFSKLDLFNTSTTGYNDVFKFYNGREVNEANLITTLLDEAEIVKSTADDGSITVYLKSTAGTTKSGWEALVSQFLPGDMTLSGISGEAASTATVSAGETNAQMLVVDVLTDNSANPLSLKSLNLTAGGSEFITKARAYYLGKKNNFATTTMIGEAEVSGNDVTITCNQALAEGHNYVAIVLDINDNANTGDAVSLTLNNVTVGETQVAPETQVSASRNVNNVCRATQGSHSHIISGDWTFTNTEGYSGKYETVDADYIVTFTPAEEGYMTEIDFSAFDVYYASSSYGTHAVFEIYSGKEVNSANLLWNLKDNSEQNVGPGKKLRSTSADGSLTIRFNPKTSSSYYAATGWTATVRPFKNHDMEVKSVSVNQTSSDVLAPGAAGAQLIDFTVENEGTLTTKVVKSINLDLKESHNTISKVSVLYNNTDDFASAIAFGSVENPATSEITIAGEQAMAESGNHFWVTVDVINNPEPDAQVDAKLLSFTCADGVTTTVENGDPEGYRTVKYIYLLESGNNVITITNPLMFYDDGGADGKVSKGLSGTVTFLPGRDNSAVQINTNGTFSIGSGYMYVYNGREVNDDNLLGRFSTTTGPANLISKAEDGSMTVRYVGNTTATTLDGWAIEVSLHEKTPFVIDDVVATAQNENVNRSMKDALMQEIKVTVSGDKEPINIGSIKIDATGTTAATDITAANLYFSGHTAAFSTDNKVATLASVAAGENVMTLESPITIKENGDYYLWLTYDVAADATTGNTLAAQLIEISQDNNAISATATAAARQVVDGLKGNFVIGSSANATYPTFAAATAALASGVEGPVTFEVEDGTYAENIVISNVRGTSEQNTITFVSQNHDRNKVIVTGGGYSEPAYGELKKGMVFVETTPWVTFESMSFVPTSQSYPYAVHIYNQSRHFTLKDSYLKAEIVTSGYSGLSLVKTENVGTSDDKGGVNNDYFTLEGCDLYGGYIAVYASGPSPVAVADAKGYVIRNNNIAEPRSKAIYVTDVEDALIEGNTITQSTSTATSFNSMDLYRLTGHAIVRNNVINHSHSYYSQGMYLRQDMVGPAANDPILIYNNSIVISNSTSSSTVGIQFNYGVKNVALYNNTVRVSGSNGYAFYIPGGNYTYDGVMLQNNLFQNFTTTGKLTYINKADVAKSLTLKNNAVYAASGTLFETHAEDIDALNALNDANEGNFVEQADFLSDVDNHLKSLGNLAAGIPVDFITTDADGVQRDAEHPTVGAYEFVEVVEEKPEMVEGYPTVTDIAETQATVKSKWTVGGKLYYKVEQVNNTASGAPAIGIKAVSADDLKATEGVDIMADTEVATALTELTPATTYKAYLMVVSALGVESEVVETEEFTTLRHIEPLTITMPTVSDTINAGESTTLKAVIAGGDEPYTIEWRDQMNNVVGNTASIEVTPAYTWAYKATVTSADGQSATAKTAVYVLGEAVPATFDDNYLAEESFMIPDDEETFYSGSYAFHGFGGSYGTMSYWSGYAIANQTANTFTGLDDQYHTSMGGGRNSANYGVAYPYNYAIDITNKVDGDSISGMYITNNAYAINSISNGDAAATAFKQGSWFMVTATGTDAQGNSKSVDFYLADYRSTNEADHYAITTWEWLDLRPLGKVTTVKFTFTGSDTGRFGLNTPAYFCMEDLNGEREMGEATRILKTGNRTIDLSELFTIEDNGATLHYFLEDEPLKSEQAPALRDIESDDMDIAMGENGMLNVNGKVNMSEKTVVVGLTQKGKTQYVALTIKIDNVTGIDGIVVDGGKVVKSRHYVNVAGQVSDKPFNGVNIVVTTFIDGTTTTVKKIMK